MKDNRAEEQARMQLESIMAMVKRLEHVLKCNGDSEECDLSDKEILDGLELTGEVATEEDREGYHDIDSARTAITEDPLSVLVRSGWVSPGEKALEPEEYEILLCTGGPACRIVGDLEGGAPITAALEYQDWGTPWTDCSLSNEEEEHVLVYARQFYFDV